MPTNWNTSDQMCPDGFFNAEQVQRLEELMGRWRTARDNNSSLSVDEQAELHALVEAELAASAQRAAALIRQLRS
jgi:hypothetical protein